MATHDPHQEDSTGVKVSTLRFPDPMSKQLGAIPRAEGLPVSEVLRERIETTSPPGSPMRSSKSAAHGTERREGETTSGNRGQSCFRPEPCQLRRTAADIWVLRENKAAQAFYRSLDFQATGVARTGPPGLPRFICGETCELGWPQRLSDPCCLQGRDEIR